MNGYIWLAIIGFTAWCLWSRNGGSRRTRGQAGAAQRGGTATKTRDAGPARGWMASQAAHEAAHAGIAHGVGVSPSNIWVTLDPGGCYCGPGPAAWGLSGAQWIAFYIADRYNASDRNLLEYPGNHCYDAGQIQAELREHPSEKRAALLAEGRRIARRYAHSGFARKVETQVRATRRFNA